jgi:hypothetical protein
VESKTGKAEQGFRFADSQLKKKVREQPQSGPSAVLALRCDENNSPKTGHDKRQEWGKL